MTTTPLADELMLLAHDEVTGKPSRSDVLDLGLAGAVMIELALAGRVDVVARKLVVTDPTPTGDEVADRMLLRISADPRTRAPKTWLHKVKKGLRAQVGDRLVARGLVRHEEATVLGVFRVTRYPAASAATEADLRARLESCVLRGAEPDERTAALAGLVHAVGLRKQVFPTADRRTVERRMKQARRGRLGG